MEENDRLIKGRLLCAAAAERNPYVIIDAGARGNLPEPWSLMAPDNVRVHGFEPDPEAYKELEKLHTLNRLYHPFAPMEQTRRHSTAFEHVARHFFCLSAQSRSAISVPREKYGNQSN